MRLLLKEAERQGVCVKTYKAKKNRLLGTAKHYAYIKTHASYFEPYFWFKHKIRICSM